MMLQKWDEHRKAYQPYHVPDTWHVVSYTDNMNETINCACCGKQMMFGNSYTSLEIHTKGGFGYGVCEECHKKEVQRKEVQKCGKKPEKKRYLCDPEKSPDCRKRICAYVDSADYRNVCYCTTDPERARTDSKGKPICIETRQEYE